MSGKAEKDYKLSLFIFRRDLRLTDNTALLEACKRSKSVIPAFFLDHRLVDPSGNKFRPNLLQFMFESLEELDEALSARGSRLYLFYGDDLSKVLETLLENSGIESVFVNEDYTPFSLNRDASFRDICDNYGVDFNSRFDLLLTRPGNVLNSNNEPYKVFSWFFRTAGVQGVREPENNNYRNFYKAKIASEKRLYISEKILTRRNPSLAQRGGRENALEKLNDFSQHRDYDQNRNYPAVEGTTKLSAHLKFGTISVRELYWKIKNNLDEGNRLINGLYWRDFFAHLCYFYPHVFTSAFNSKYNSLEWENDTRKFEKWCSGNTGFPIVDAGMRELNKTGWMHNRVRMIVASFLTKDLHIDWKWGERYFASKLVDYDPCSNNGGWQWAASTGADAQPYFRVFNPWLQQKRYDPDAIYIKNFVSELTSLDAEDIHRLYEYEGSLPVGYPRPLVDHGEEADKAKKYYKAV